MLEDGSEDKSVVICAHCHSPLSHSSTGTTNMISHLKAKHEEVWNILTGGKGTSKTQKITKFINTDKEWKCSSKCARQYDQYIAKFVIKKISLCTLLKTMS